jgi:hypothetical protein
MGEIERQGFITYEFRRQRGDQEFLNSLAEDAAALLEAQANHSPDVLARPWKKLDEAEQAALGDELLALPKLGLAAGSLDVFAYKLSEGVIGLIHEAAETYHDTLPFTKEERLWLTDNRFRAIENCEAELVGTSAVHWVMAQREEIVMLGRRQAVSGAELIGREWNWIRGAGEYAGSSTYGDATKLALQGIVELFDFDKEAY